METLRSSEFRFTDPDVIRAWMGDHKRRDLLDKTCSEANAVSRFVKDGDSIFFDSSSFSPRPLGLIREIIRQGPEPPVLRHVHCSILRTEVDPARTIIGRTGKG